jgi:hypothetical protein
VLTGVLALAPAAVAESWLTFGFTDLAANFTPTGPDAGVLTVAATAVAVGGAFDSGGDATRVLAPEGVAEYNSGFLTSGTSADFQFLLEVAGITPNSANATGTFLLTDANGDTLSGDIAGTWEPLPNFAAFEGLLSNVTISNTSGDGTFDGPSLGSFDSTFPEGPTYPGAFTTLITGEWFDDAFEDANALQQAAVVPEPAALAVLILFGQLALRRSR